MSTAAAELAALWKLTGGETAALQQVSLTGEEPALPGIYLSLIHI